MRVKATREGYYGLVRRNQGEVFEMAESAMKKDKAGKPELPTWVELARGVPESAPKGTIQTGVEKKAKPAAPAGSPAENEPEEVSGGGETVI
jgi:hypothetical protein